MNKNGLLRSIVNKRLLKKKRSKSACLYECEFKIAVLGSSCVGKTSILNRIVNEEFTEEHKPTDFEVTHYALTLDDMNVMLKFIDVSCKDEFSLTRRRAIQEADAFILVFSMEDRASFEELENLKIKIEAMKGSRISDLAVVVVGNKADTSTTNVSSEEIAKLCFNEMDSIFVECSAKEDRDLTKICSLVYDELGVCEQLYEKVLEIQCKDEVKKVIQKNAARRK